MAEARSNYQGLKLVLTTTPGGATVLTVSVKNRAAHWAEWSQLVPATIRRDLPPPSDVNEALELVSEYLAELMRSWGDY